MSEEIKGSPEMLEASANSIEQNAAILAKELQSVNDLLTTLQRTFIGKRAEGFYRQYEPTHEELRDLTHLVRAFAADLRTAAARLRRADEA
jgi:WXG100 family type VII secretion target